MAPYVEIVVPEESHAVSIGDSVFRIRRLTPEIADEIAQRHRQRRKDNQGRLYYEIPPERQRDYTRDLYDYLILDWTDVIHPVTKAPVPCDAEHKVMLHQSVRERLLETADAGNVSGLRTDPTAGSARPSGGS